MERGSLVVDGGITIDKATARLSPKALKLIGVIQNEH